MRPQGEEAPAKTTKTKSVSGSRFAVARYAQGTVTDATPHLHFMMSALRLAAKGRGQTSPNPMVGAIVVNRGRVVGHGYHHRPGLPHAEVLALERAGPHSSGATLYVTLEPCCHLLKRTAPCVPAVIHSGVRRVVMAQCDPNRWSTAEGLLPSAGRIGLTTGIARGEAEALNHTYRHWATDEASVRHSQGRDDT